MAKSTAKAPAKTVSKPRRKPARKGGSLAAQAYKQIKEKILTLHFLPGQYLNEGALCSMLGAGRTPVHQALQRLELEGLVEIMGDHVAVLTDMAIASEKIDEAKVEEARRRAEARLQEKLSGEEVASVNASLARSAAQLRVKRRHRTG